MGVGVKLPGWILQQDDSRTVLDVSSIQDSIDSGVIQRVYADGRQRSIAGYATQAARALTIQEVTFEQWEWLKARSGQLVVSRDPFGEVAEYIVGGISRTLDANNTVADGSNVENTNALNVNLVLFFNQEII